MFRPKAKAISLFEGAIVRRAIVDAFKKLSPQLVAKNPVMFVVEIVSVLSTVFFLRDIVQGGGDDSWQNVAAVAPTLHADDVRSVLVVTDPFHEDRAMAIASSFGFSPSPTPSLHSPIRGITQLGYLVKESVEVAAGRIVGYGTLSSIGQW